MREGNPIQWAPRIRRQLIRRLYEDDARGIHDEALLEEVGLTLYARCEDFITACRAVAGEARCPRCGAAMPHDGDRGRLLRCTCGWELTWDAYFRSLQHKQLSGAREVRDLFAVFVSGWPAAGDARQKMLLIDQLLHGFHYFAAQQMWTRPVAVNLIEGPMTEVIAFLDALSYGPDSVSGARERWAQWHATMDANLRRWGQRMPRPAQKDARREGKPG